MKRLGLVLSVLLAGGGYLGVSLWAGWQEVIAAFARIPPWGFTVLLGLSLLNYLLRFGRWQRYLRQLGHPQPLVISLLIYCSGFALTTTPGKAGEIVRSVFLKALAVPYALSTAAFVSERLADLLAILLLALPGLGSFPRGETLMGLGIVMVSLIFMVLLGSKRLTSLRAFFKAPRGKSWRLVNHGLELLSNTRRLHRASLLPFSISLSILAWGAEALGFHLLLSWLNFTPTLPQSFAIYALSMLAGALSFLPGGLGGTEAVMGYLLVWMGMPTPQAVAATVLIRLATLWFAVALGLLALPATYRLQSQMLI